MKILNMEKAVDLYLLLENHLPDNNNIELIDFIGKIVKSIIENGDEDKYINAVSIMTGIDENEILQFTPEEVLNQFAEGLVENRIIDLIEFMKGLTNARSGQRI